MLRRILIVAIACTCMILGGFMLGINYTATNAEISVTPKQEIYIDILGNRWIHTIEE